MCVISWRPVATGRFDGKGRTDIKGTTRALSPFGKSKKKNYPHSRPTSRTDVRDKTSELSDDNATSRFRRVSYFCTNHFTFYSINSDLLTPYHLILRYFVLTIFTEYLFQLLLICFQYFYKVCSNYYVKYVFNNFGLKLFSILDMAFIISKQL